MKKLSPKDQIKRDMRSLIRSMDFVSRHPALEKDGPEANRYAEIYQQLGLAWEFLGLQCRHWDGWRKSAEGKQACKICGKIKGTDEYWLLLPSKGRKTLGRRSVPTSKEIFPNKHAATIVDDAIEFHGAKLRLDVHNRYRSRLFRKHDFAISDERIVRLNEGGVECSVDANLIRLLLKKHKRGSEPPFSAFLDELPRKALKRFPVLLEYDRRGSFTGLTIFRPRPAKQAVPKTKNTRNASISE